MSQSSFTQFSDSEQHHLPPERFAWPIWPWLLLLAGTAIIFVARWGFAPSPEPRGDRHPAVGQKIPKFQLQQLTGGDRVVTEEDLADKVTLVNFWGPWCGPCAMEFPHLVELEAHFRSKPNFQFFSVSSNQNPRDDRGLAESTTEFLKYHNATFPTYRDPEAATLIALAQNDKIGNFGFPTNIVLGPGGIIRAFLTGYSPGDESEIRRAIEKALAESPK
jgi:thiol-disulfide isomerase/thioredoxin